MQLIFILLYK